MGIGQNGNDSMRMGGNENSKLFYTGYSKRYVKFCSQRMCKVVTVGNVYSMGKLGN